MGMNKLDVYLGADGEYTFLPFHLPAAKSGRCEVTREVLPKGKVVTVVSIRNAIFMGLQQTRAMLDRDVVLHRLIENDENGDPKELWMTSLPQEIEQCTRQLERAHGHVLVGGLGLGLAVSVLSVNPKVESMIVVERNPDIIKLVWDYVPKNCAFIVQKDLFDYLKGLKKWQARLPFDFAFFDIWTPTSQSVHPTVVQPLRKLAVGVIEQEDIECWNEDEMLGQTELTLDSRLNIEYGLLPNSERNRVTLLSDKDFLGIRNQFNMDVWPFLNWVRKHKPTLNQAREEMRFYLKALKDAESWDSKWKAYENV